MHLVSITSVVVFEVAVEAVYSIGLRISMLLFVSHRRFHNLMRFSEDLTLICSTQIMEKSSSPAFSSLASRPPHPFLSFTHSINQSVSLTRVYMTNLEADPTSHLHHHPVLYHNN
jgi:hypothetical protein